MALFLTLTDVCVLSLSRSLRNKEKSEKVNLSPSPAAVSFRSLEASPLTCPLCARAGPRAGGPRTDHCKLSPHPGLDAFAGLQLSSYPVLSLDWLWNWLFGVDFNYKQCEVVQSDIFVICVWGCVWGGIRGACNCLVNFCSANFQKLLQDQHVGFMVLNCDLSFTFTQSTLIDFIWIAYLW